MERNIQCIIKPKYFKEDNLDDNNIKDVIKEVDNFELSVYSKIRLYIKEKIENYDLQEWLKEEGNLVIIFFFILIIIFIFFCSFLFRKYYIASCYSI